MNCFLIPMNGATVYPLQPQWQDWKHLFSVLLECMHLRVCASSYMCCWWKSCSFMLPPLYTHPFSCNRAATSLYLSWEMAYLCGDMILLHYNMMLLTHWCSVIMYRSKSMPRKQFHHMAQSCTAKSYETACGKCRIFSSSGWLALQATEQIDVNQYCKSNPK